MTRLRAWLLVFMVVALGAPAAEAAISRGSSSRPLLDADRVGADYSHSVPALTDRLKAAEERLVRAAACASLCELAAGIEAHPFGQAVAVTPFGTLDAWGNYRFTSELTTSKNRFGFTGHYWDKEASLYYAKARYYDPFTARFTQADAFLGTIDEPPSLHRYQYAAANPTMFVDPSGHVAIIDNVLGGAASVAIGWGVSKFTGREYTREDLAVDFGLGFASSGLSSLKYLKYAKEADAAANGARLTGRLAAQYGVGLTGEVARHEIKGEQYTIEGVSQQAVYGALLGEGGDLLAKGVSAGSRRVSAGLSKADIDMSRLLTQDVSNFVPREIKEGTADALESIREFASRLEFGITPAGPAMVSLPTVRLRPSAFEGLERRQTTIYEIVERATLEPVYIGKTRQLGGGKQGTELRLAQHEYLKPEWRGKQYRTREVLSGSWTDFETATHEMKAMMKRGGPKRLNPNSPLQNRNRSITPKKFEKYRNMHTDYDLDPFDGGGE